MRAQVRCASCGEIFPADASLADASAQGAVTCPACGYEGRPGGVMRVTGPPSLELFTRNWQRAQEAARSDEAEDGES